MFDKGFRLVAEIKKLEENSTAYIVGGAVRDYLLGKECNDIDIATSVDIDIIEKHFKTHDIGNNKDFGILVVEFEGEVFEVANYREDGEYSDGRRPDDVTIVNDFETDSKRRDFTINAMGMDEDGTIIDYHGGQEDLKNGIIRTVGNPIERFEEDYLRIIRAIRFAATYDFELMSVGHDSGNGTLEAISLMSKYITKNVSNERIWQELWKLAKTDGFSKGIILMKELGILKDILPEIDCMDKYPHYKKHHPEGGVWEHVVGVIKNLDDKSPVVKFGGLFHDIGKPVAYKWYPEKGKYHYIRHDFMGLDVFDEVVERLRIPKDIANEIKYCIKNHMRMHHFNNMKDAKCYALMDSPYWESLYQVSYADDRSRLYLCDREWWNKADEKIERLQVLLEQKKSMEKILNGHLVMEILEVDGGRVVGDVLKRAKAFVINNKLDVNDENDLAKIKKHIKTFK